MNNGFGNTFDATSVSYGHAKKVWREIKDVFPGGGVVSNVSDFVSAGIIPAGTPVQFDSSAKTIKAYKAADITGASDLSTLGINGYLQDDIVVTNESTVATGTVVYRGEIYEFAFSSAVVTKLKTLAVSNNVVFVL